MLENQGANQNIQFQQNLATLPVAIVVLVAESNRLESLEPLVPHVLEVLKNVKTRTLIRIDKAVLKAFPDIAIGPRDLIEG